MRFSVDVSSSHCFLMTQFRAGGEREIATHSSAPLTWICFREGKAPLRVRCLEGKTPKIRSKNIFGLQSIASPIGWPWLEQEVFLLLARRWKKSLDLNIWSSFRDDKPPEWSECLRCFWVSDGDFVFSWHVRGFSHQNYGNSFTLKCIF